TERSPLMLTLLVRFTVQPGMLDEFLTALRANARASLRDEPGCLRFDIHLSLADDHEILLYEIYADREAFEVDHRSAEHYAAFQEVVARCVTAEGHVNTFAVPAFPEDLPEAAGAARTE